MLATIVKSIGKLWKSDGHEDLSTPQNAEATFALVFEKLPVGTLSLKDGRWTFRYTEPFKRQDKIKPLPDFPDVNKVYTSEELYPFFIQRIPSLSQPKVKEAIEKEKIDQTNIVELLKKFGRLSINNPFKLEAN